ncbi:MAG: hypothetical protein IIW47_03235 [Bacteroidales bacterium]|nr:hypothetical protein [Bacteroidales bacterium]
MLLLIFLAGVRISYAQPNEAVLMAKYQRHFNLLDSLIFRTDSEKLTVQEWDTSGFDKVTAQGDSLIGLKVDRQIKALKAETGLLVSGQTYYRLDEGFGIDDEDALSRYNAKMQVELRWNFLSSSLIDRKSRVGELQVKGDIERTAIEREYIQELAERQEEVLRIEYDSLLAGILQLRIGNLSLLAATQQYLVSDRSISTEELLKIMDEQAIAERQLAAIPGKWPLVQQLSSPQGQTVKVDTLRFMEYVMENDLQLHQAGLQMDLLRMQEESTNYWRTLNLSPFVRYSYYVRPEMKNSANVDAGMAFQIPLSSSQSKKRKALESERMQMSFEMEKQKSLLAGNIRMLFVELERANNGLCGETARIASMKDYMQMRRENYQGHIGEYNVMQRLKEYNHYLVCWENYYSYLYRRNSVLVQLQAFLGGAGILEFCEIGIK